MRPPGQRAVGHVLGRGASGFRRTLTASVGVEYLGLGRKACRPVPRPRSRQAPGYGPVTLSGRKAVVNSARTKAPAENATGEGRIWEQAPLLQQYARTTVRAPPLMARHVWTARRKA